jgi:hypothetical protein
MPVEGFMMAQGYEAANHYALTKDQPVILKLYCYACYAWTAIRIFIHSMTGI